MWALRRFTAFRLGRRPARRGAGSSCSRIISTNWRSEPRGIDLVARRGVRTIVSTHDLEVAQDSQRTLLIHDGRLHADGEPAEVVAAYRSLVARDAERGSGRA